MTPEDVFAEFYAARKDACLRALVAGGTDRAAAEEAVAEAFARAWASWPKVSRHPAPSAWVIRTAMNHHVSRWRRMRREVALTPEVAAGAAEWAVDHAERDDLLRAVAASDGRMDEVTVRGRPGYLPPTANGWLLQAGMSDGTVFVLQAPADFTPAQVVEIAEGVGRP